MECGWYLVSPVLRVFVFVFLVVCGMVSVNVNVLSRNSRLFFRSPHTNGRENSCNFPAFTKLLRQRNGQFDSCLASGIQGNLQARALALTHTHTREREREREASLTHSTDACYSFVHCRCSC